MSDNERFKPYRIFDSRWRIVYGPSEELKRPLQVVAHHLDYKLSQDPDFKSLFRQDAIHGFVKNRSHITHALVHKGAGTVVALDLYHAFEYVPQEQVLHGLERIGVSGDIISFLQDNAFIDRKLVTGFPTSPVLFNLALLPMDVAIYQFARGRGFRYSRYADDLAISKRPVFTDRTTESFSTSYGKKQLMMPIDDSRQGVEGVSFIPQEDINLVAEIVRQHGYDPHKIRVGHPGKAPFEVCGLSLYQDRVTLPGKALRKARGQLHQWLVLSDKPDHNKALALLGHIKQIRPLPGGFARYEELARGLLEEQKKLRISARDRRRPAGFVGY